MSSKSYVVEFLGTFILVFFIGMCRITSKEDLLSVALCTFFMMTSLVHTFFHLSGSMFNPILSLSLIITKQIKFSVAIVYCLAHLAGSFMAGTILFLINRGKETGNYYGSPQMNAAMRTEGMVFEMISMFFLVLIYNFFMSNASAPKNVYGTAIGGVYLFSIIGFGFLSGGATNFSFVFGPSIFMENFRDWIYYVLGHTIGGVAGGVIYRLFLMKIEDDEDEDDQLEGMELSAVKRKVE